jgi:DNA-binding MarR family transcriptional regulator
VVHQEVVTQENVHQEVVPRENKERSAFGSASEVQYALAAFEQSNGHGLRDRGMKLRHYDLMLALKAEPKRARSIREIATRLGVRSHAASQAVFHLANRNLVRVRRDGKSGRRLALELTSRGDRLLQELSREEQQHLQIFAPVLLTGLQHVLGKLAG